MFGRKSRHPETPAAAKSAKPDPKGSSTVTTSATPAAARQASGDVQAKGKLAYEERRAQKAGMGLEKWMAEKERRARAERDAIAQTRRKTDAERLNQTAKPGLLRRLLDRAHRPL